MTTPDMSMVEKVAEAIYEAVKEELAMPGKFAKTYVARAAIQAMHEPTGNMLMSALHTRGSGGIYGTWTAMIDAALVEGVAS